MKTTPEERTRVRDHIRQDGYDLSTEWLLKLLDDAEDAREALNRIYEQEMCEHQTFAKGCASCIAAEFLGYT